MRRLPTFPLAAAVLISLTCCGCRETVAKTDLVREAARLAKGDVTPDRPAKALPAPAPAKPPSVREPRPAPSPAIRKPRPVPRPVPSPGKITATAELQAVVRRAVTSDGTTVVELANGMTVIIKPTRTTPVVSVRGYVRTGGLFEGQWLGCGLSHLLEHLVAKGAVHDGQPQTGAVAPSKQTRDRVAEIGGQSNAYTSLARTCYHISAAASKTADCIDMIAEWMSRARITREDFHREHGVVQRELEMGKDEPHRQLWYAHAANAFAGHPAAVPVIGYARPLAKVTLQDVRAYHRKTYIPQNMVFCVVGDVDTDEVLKRVRLAFGGFHRRRREAVSLPQVRPLAGVRRIVRHSPILRSVMETISFQTVALIHEDLYGLDVLSYVLGKGRASRLVQKIEREKKLVTSISSSSWTPDWGKGYFAVTFRAESDKADAAEQAILAELRSVINAGVTDNELARAKRQKTADFVHGQQTVEDIAGTLAVDYMSTGQVDFSRNYTQRIQAVTADQVRLAARKYFTFNAMAVTRMAPPWTATTRPAPTAAAPAIVASPQLFSMSEGLRLRVVLYPVDTVALVSMAYTVKGGLLAEIRETNGLGTLMTALSTRGAGRRSARQIAEFFDAAGGSITANCGNSTFYWQATVLDDSFDQALEIFAHVIRRPRFDPQELEILRPKILAGIKQTQEHWFGQLKKYHRSKFFINSPYGMLPGGREEVVERAAANHLRQFHELNIRGLVTEPAVLTIYGHFDPREVRKKIEEVFACPMKGVRFPGAEPPPRRVGPEGELYVMKTDNRQAGIMVAAPGMEITNLEDRFAMTVLDAIISGYHLPSGWLHAELRGKKLVYVVHAYNWAPLRPGAFLVYAGCQPGKAPEVVEIIKKTLRKAAAYRPSQKEIDLAVNSILTAEMLDNQSMSQKALRAGLDELYGFGYDFCAKLETHYRKVTPAEVARVAKKYLTGGYVVTVTTPKPELFQAATSR